MAKQTGKTARTGKDRLLRQSLESLSRAGVTHLPKARPRKQSMPRPAEATPRAAVTKAVSKDPVALLSVIQQEVAGCRKCAELAATRCQTVFGSGNPRPRLVFMGEAPGADEDQQGLPFVGRAGQLLTKIIEACTLSRDEVYILNTLKCRPPNNRNPLPAEADNCRGFLDRQLAVLAPEYICCLGTVAAQNLLRSTQTIGRLRGSFHDYQGIRVLCTYHPAYLLRNPPAKKDCWQDMQILMNAMGIAMPGRSATG